MEEHSLGFTNANALTTQRNKCNQLSSRYGLELTEAQMVRLARSRERALRDTNRVEFGEGVLYKLVYAFCDSPYISREEYAATLEALQELFYALKNDCDDALSDDELIDGLKAAFDGPAQGSLEYVESLTPGELYRLAARGGVR